MPRKIYPEVSTYETLMETATDYHEGLKLLGKREDFGHSIQAFYMLTCMCLELSFKAVWKKKGATENDLREVSHDLETVFLRACESGLCGRFVPAPWDVPTIVAFLHPLHKAGQFRYQPEEFLLDVPHPDHIMRVLDAHMNEVGVLLFFPEENL
jgi:hypothetical protein